MGDKIWTIKGLLDWMVPYFEQKGVDSPRLTAELLLSYVLGIERIQLYVRFNEQVDGENLAKLRGLVKRTAEHEPYAYLIGRTEFYSMTFKVNRDCLIPRPETELLVERAIEFLRTRNNSQPQQVCDLCTGSGCVAVAIAKNFDNCNVTATDICDDALKVAAENIALHELDEKIELLAGDLFTPIIEGLDATKFDLIVSNPPYVSDAEFEILDANVKDHEPRKALYGGTDGLDIYKRIVDGVMEHLADDGALIMEIGYLQGDAIRQLLDGIFKFVHIEKDFSDNDRVVIASNQQIKGYVPDQPEDMPEKTFFEEPENSDAEETS